MNLLHVCRALQVAAVDGVPGSSFDDAIEWKERARSRLLQGTVN
jgi:hypothetical protein